MKHNPCVDEDLRRIVEVHGWHVADRWASCFILARELAKERPDVAAALAGKKE